MKSVFVAAVAAWTLVGCGVSQEALETAEDGLGTRRELHNVTVDASRMPIVLKTADEVMLVSKIQMTSADGSEADMTAQDCKYCACGPDGCHCWECVPSDGGGPKPKPKPPMTEEEEED